MTVVTWLHISDLHWRESEAYDANIVAKALLRDLANLAQISPGLTQIDLIFVTGDIAFAGRSEDYELARRFFTELLQTTKVRRNCVFAVPGNHDVDRMAITDYARDTVSTLTNRKAVNNLLEDEASRATALQRLHRYKQFVNAYLSRHLHFDSTHYFYVKQRTFFGRQIVVLGLNSSWASASDADRNQLLIGEQQVREALEQARSADIRIALLHHPFEWLQDFDRNDCEPQLLRRCNFVLHGHLHRTGISHLRAPGSEATVIGAGACYDTREFPNAYNLVQLDLSSGRGTVYLRMYSDRQGGFWTKDVLTYQDALGEYTFDLPSAWIIPFATTVKPNPERVETLVADVWDHPQPPKETEARVEFDAKRIHGIADEWPLSPPIVVRIGRALGKFIRARSRPLDVMIGRDTRPSGVGLLNNLSAGLASQGINVYDIGVMPAAGVTFVTRLKQAGLGIIISAPQGPVEYNSIMLVGQNGLTLQREEEVEIENLINIVTAEDTARDVAPGQCVDGRHLVQLYIQDHVKRCPVDSLGGLKVVLDCANGSASRVAPEVFKRLGADVEVVFDALVSSKINYRCGSEYVLKYPQGLSEMVQRHKAIYGFAFDGDGSRLAVVDVNGQVFDGNDLLFVLARNFPGRKLGVGDTVVTTYQANTRLEKALGDDGIHVSMDARDLNLEEAMWEGDHPLGGEPGGKIIINDGYHTAADAVYAATVLAGVLVRNQDTTLREMVDPLHERIDT